MTACAMVADFGDPLGIAPGGVIRRNPVHLPLSGRYGDIGEVPLTEPGGSCPISYFRRHSSARVLRVRQSERRFSSVLYSPAKPVLVEKSPFSPNVATAAQNMTDSFNKKPPHPVDTNGKD